MVDGDFSDGTAHNNLCYTDNKLLPLNALVIF